MELKNLIGHRGFAGLRPENTLCGFSFAAEFGLQMVEFDVQLTSDDEWVVFHDITIDRTTAYAGKVKEYTLQDLTEMDAGSWFHPPYPQEFIPSLLHTMQLTHALGVSCNIEIKDALDTPTKHARLMSTFITNQISKQPLPLISSFDLPCLIALRQEFPTLPIAYLIDYFAPDSIDIAIKHDFQRIHCDVNHITVEHVQAAAQHDLPVYLFTVNDKLTATTWLDAGVAGFFTDRADLLLDKEIV